jgi:uncharacterized delta-60 repeat protein
MTRRVSAVLVLVVAAVLGVVSVASAAPGLDPSFGEGGLAFSGPKTAGAGRSLEVHAGPDGSATIASQGSNIVRFGPEGSWDSGFAGSGTISLLDSDLGIEGGRVHPWSTAVDSKGRVLVFGGFLDGQTQPSGSTEGGSLEGSEAVVFRFDPDGSPDPSFGEGGVVRSSFGIESTYPDYLAHGMKMVAATAGTVDSQDRPVLALNVTEPVGGCYAKGGPGDQPRAVVRLTEAGLPDPTFGENGVARTPGTALLPFLGLTAGDRPIIDVGPTGGREPECHRGATVIRFGADGTRLGSFGHRGVVHVKAFGVALAEPSGATILSRPERPQLELRRRGPKGNPDRSFGTDGLAKVPAPSKRKTTLEPVAVDSSGRILLAGSIGAPDARGKPTGGAALIVGRLLPNGRLDRGFGEGGWILTRLAPGLELEGIGGALDPSGRLLVAGVTRTAGETGGSYVLARYLLEN